MRHDITKGKNPKIQIFLCGNLILGVAFNESINLQVHILTSDEGTARERIKLSHFRQFHKHLRVSPI